MTKSFVYITERNNSFNHLYFLKEITSVLFGLFVYFLAQNNTVKSVSGLKANGGGKCLTSIQAFALIAIFSNFSPFNVRYIVHRITS